MQTQGRDLGTVEFAGVGSQGEMGKSMMEKRENRLH